MLGFVGLFDGWFVFSHIFFLGGGGGGGGLFDVVLSYCSFSHFGLIVPIKQRLFLFRKSMKGLDKNLELVHENLANSSIRLFHSYVAQVRHI